MHKKFFLFFLLAFFFFGQTEAVTYYGQVLSKNTPINGLEVSAEWLDQKGIYHMTITRTLTKNQAIRKGDSLFEGYYFFEGGSVYPMENTNVVFSFTGFPYNLIVRALPGQSVVRMNTLSFHYMSDYSNNTIKVNQTPENFSYSREEIINTILSNLTSAVPVEANGTGASEEIGNIYVEEKTNEKQNSTVGQPPEEKKNDSNILKDTFIILALIIGLGIFFGIGYLFVKQGSVVIDTAIEEYGPTLKKPRKNIDTKIKNISAKILFVSLKDDLIQIIGKISESGDNCAIIMENGEYYGYLKEKEIFSYKGGFDKKVSDIQSLVHKEDIMIDSKKTIEDAYTMMKNLSLTKLIVKEGEKITGQVNAFDVCKVFSRLKQSQEIKNRADIPLVRDVLDKECPVVEKNTQIWEVIEFLSGSDAEIVLVQEGEYLGEITPTEILGGMIKYGKYFKEKTAGEIMNSVHSVSPDSDIFDANEYILERGISSYPVIINGTLLGVIRPFIILGEIINYLKRE